MNFPNCENEMKPIKDKLTAAEEKLIVMDNNIAAVEEISYITLSHVKTGNNTVNCFDKIPLLWYT